MHTRHILAVCLIGQIDGSRFRAFLPKLRNDVAVHCRHSKPGSVKPLTIIDSEADWTPSSLEGREREYTLEFQESDVKELIAAVDKIKAKGVSTEEDVKKVIPGW